MSLTYGVSMVQGEPPFFPFSFEFPTTDLPKWTKVAMMGCKAFQRTSLCKNELPWNLVRSGSDSLPLEDEFRAAEPAADIKINYGVDDIEYCKRIYLSSCKSLARSQRLLGTPGSRYHNQAKILYLPFRLFTSPVPDSSSTQLFTLITYICTSFTVTKLFPVQIKSILSQLQLTNLSRC